METKFEARIERGENFAPSCKKEEEGGSNRLLGTKTALRRLIPFYLHVLGFARGDFVTPIREE